MLLDNLTAMVDRQNSHTYSLYTKVKILLISSGRSRCLLMLYENPSHRKVSGQQISVLQEVLTLKHVASF